VRISAFILSSILALALSVQAAGAGSQFPVERAGSGNEPTGGGGTLRDAAFHARSAAIQWDTRTRSLTLYVFERPGLTCSGLRRAVAVRRGRSVQVVVTRRPGRLPVDRVLRDRFVRFVQRFDATDVEIQLVQQRVALRFTRIDSGKNGVWHGRLDVSPRVLEGGRYSYSGTFAANWCT
jgi:hypothetical protein